MDRDHSRFRSKARVVAFVDLILSSMSLCLCLIVFIALVSISGMSDADIARKQQRLRDSSADFDLSAGATLKEGNLEETNNSRYPGRSTFLFPASDPAFRKDNIIKVMWIFFALLTIMTGVQILAAIRLLNATQIGKDPIGALKLCRFWRFVASFVSGLLIFNFLSSFRHREENFMEVSFLLTNIVIRALALYVVQQFMNELDMTIVSTLPIRRIHHDHASSSHLAPSFAGMSGRDGYLYGAQFSVPMPSQVQAPPPKYEDVVKEPYKPSGEA